MYVPRHTVTPTFRRDLLAELPGLGEEVPYWRLASVILFGGSKVEEHSGRLRVGRRLLAEMFDDPDRQYAMWAKGHGSSVSFLEAFARDVIPLEIGDFSYRRERTIAPCVPPCVRELARAERRNPSRDRVWMDTGAPVTANTLRAVRGRRRKDGLEAVAAAGAHPTAELLRYLNEELPSNSFARLVPHLAEAHALVDALDLSDESRERQHDLLRLMADDPRPYYQTSEDGLSARLWPRGIGMLGLKTAVRRCLTERAGWREADLRSAHLAMVAAPPPVGWDVPEVRAFLGSGSSIWSHLAGELGVDEALWKPFLKRRLYGICYGEGVHRRRTAFADEAPHALKDGAKRLAAVPLMRSVLVARHEAVQRVRHEGGAEDAFGTWLPLVRHGKDDHGIYGERTNVLSVLAMVAQSWELRLLEPVVALARSERARDHDHGFNLTLWQHDGFALKAPSGPDERRWSKEIETAVNARCAALRVPTRLEWRG